jgi:hypothetical protein
VDRVSELSLTLVRLPRTIVSAAAPARVEPAEAPVEEEVAAESRATEPFALSRVEQASVSAIVMRIAGLERLVMSIVILPSL